jgi:hypothetical protein
MALELIAAIVAAFGFAGIAMLLRKLTRQRLPKWIVPAAAGAGLLGFTVWSEYDWFSRVSGNLPEGVIVVHAEAEASPLRPWSYLFPMTTRFVAMDTGATVPHPEAETLRLVRLYNFIRWGGVREGFMVVDCEGRRQVLVTEGVVVSPDGQMTGGEWVAPGPDDAIQMAACTEV